VRGFGNHNRLQSIAQEPTGGDARRSMDGLATTDDRGLTTSFQPPMWTMVREAGTKSGSPM
jgi:hypothetical protein